MLLDNTASYSESISNGSHGRYSPNTYLGQFDAKKKGSANQGRNGGLELYYFDPSLVERGNCGSLEGLALEKDPVLPTMGHLGGLSAEERYFQKYIPARSGEYRNCSVLACQKYILCLRFLHGDRAPLGISFL